MTPGPDDIEQIFTAEHAVDPSVARALEREDLDRVRGAALDRESPYRRRALEIVAAADRQEAHALLSQILRTRDDDDDVRAAAASLLAHTALDAEPELVAALADAPPRVQFAIADALARTGGPDALEALDRLAAGGDGALHEQARFARTVIAHRHGMSGYEPPVPPPDQILELGDRRAAPVAARDAPRGERARALASLGPRPYGLNVARGPATLIECGGEHLLLLLDQELVSGGAETASSRPLLAGVIARRAPVDGSYSARWLVLSWPGDDGIQLALHRPSALQVAYGEATREGSALQFALRAVRGRGRFAFEIHGRIDGGLQNLEGMTELEATQQGAPAPIDPERLR